MTGSALCCVDVELFGLAGVLRASPDNDDDVLETVRIKRRPRQMDDAFALIARKVLRLSVRSQDEDPGNRSLGDGGGQRYWRGATEEIESVALVL
jgi:hypothetical protein